MMSLLVWLNSMKKMEYKEGGNTEILNGTTMNLKGNLISPASDCNSNNLQIPKENLFLCSTDSMHDCPDFLQDNSDYQWFLDYGYKDNNYSHHQSVLSMSRSQDLVYYEDLSRNLDANLAEVDMDDFNREDIHSVLSSLPNIPGVEEREMFASVTGSMMVKFGFDESISQHSSSQEEANNGVSMCKSQPLFSPVHESYMPNANLSVDSLDLSENDINLMVTCQGNKLNYTIAFEGSTIMGTDDSGNKETGTIKTSILEGNDREHNERFAQELRNSMTCSDSPFTTWSKIKKDSSENLQLRRHPSGNNNNSEESATSCDDQKTSNTTKSQSLPNLFYVNQKPISGLSLSVKVDKNCSSNKIDCEQQCIKLYDIQKSCNSRSVDHSTFSSPEKPQNFSLLKLFIKQKNGSLEGMSNYTKDVSTNRIQNNRKEAENEQKSIEEAKNYLMNEINKTKNKNSFMNVIQNAPPQTTDKQFKIDMSNSKCTGNTLDILSQNVGKKFGENDNPPKDGYDSGHENKYFSDESTQENGSNTESAENLMCNCAKTPVLNDLKKKLTERSIQTSKLYASQESSSKSNMKVPVYILYPNYSLPNLEFLKKKHYVQNIDFSKVFVRPQKFHSPGSQASTPKNAAKRPFSVNDIETLKKTGFKHIRDWESLTFLLPKEYKNFLQEIPEIVSQLKDVKNSKEELVPLFCLSPPPNRKMKKSRPMSCDLNFFPNDYRNSNYSSPSSGYRGSSTMLNSNNSGNSGSSRHTVTGNGAESGSSRRSGSFMHSRQYSRNLSEGTSTRPPLPRSILRNNSLPNQQYTCKTQKENANKRYSMIEFGEKKSESDEKCTRRRSTQNFSTFQGNKSDKFTTNTPEINYNTWTKKSSRDVDVEDDFFTQEQSKIQNDLKRLEELLEISAVFGENVESFTENDMMKLRSQVSKFLTMHKNLERVSETLQTVDEISGNANREEFAISYREGNQSLDIKSLHTPHNTPEHKKPVKAGESDNGLHRDLTNVREAKNEEHSDEYDVSYDDTFNDEYFNDDAMGGLKKTVSFAERISFAIKEQCEEPLLASPDPKVVTPKLQQTSKPVSLAISEESLESSLENSASQSPLFTSTEFLHKKELVLDVKNAVDKIQQLLEETQDDPTNLCLHHLCPSLYAILSDGLKEEIETPFGPIRNSVWSVVEASSQSGRMTQTLNELVQRLNRDDIFTEGLIKFNAFIFGLMNARALSGWFAFLRTRDSLLRKYYDTSGLFLMSNIGSASVRNLVDRLINILDPLSTLQFNLDLMYQTKLLHCSLQNINLLLEDADNNAFLTPTKQLMLMKLVQSIQNSISQVGEGKKSKHVLQELDEKTSDPPVANLLENKPIRTRQKSNKARPRSGCDILGQGKEISDVTVALQKRWSGVHTNSKLVEAFDKLGNDSESDYTDSLDVQKPINGTDKSSKIGVTETDVEKLEENITKEQKKSILLSLNKKSGSKTDCKTELDVREGLENPSTSPSHKGGHKFKRLQQKWERLSGSGSEKEPQSKTTKFNQKSNSVFSEKNSCDINSTNLQSPTSRTSKIPRLVTSPSSVSPGIKGVKKMPSVTPLYSTTNIQRVVKGSASIRGLNSEIKSSSTVTNRLSRCDEKPNITSPGIVKKSNVTRPTSLPYKGSNIISTTKTEAISRRAASVSLNRKAAPKKLQVQRTVRTLTHRLPSDSGHLSFNEGEELKVVLEVDKTWLLCCRGTQKGLVPKSAVISDLEF